MLAASGGAPAAELLDALTIDGFQRVRGSNLPVSASGYYTFQPPTAFIVHSECYESRSP